MMRVVRLALLAGLAGVQAVPLPAQPTGVSRTDLQRHDLATPGREMLQVRVDLAPAAFAPAHVHPGEEVIYVLRGTLEYEVAGRGAITLRAGGVLFIPAGVAHSARNVGPGEAAELATYIVEKGKPLSKPAR